MSKGFTLIELIIVFSVMAIIGATGIAALVGYSEYQAFNTATLDVASMLQTAKVRAQSQTIPSSCLSPVQLTGYQVHVGSDINSASATTLDKKTYQLIVNCNYPLPLVLKSNTLPNSNITFSAIVDVTFPVLTGGATSLTMPAQITVNGYGFPAKVISVKSDGTITVSTPAS